MSNVLLDVQGLKTYFPIKGGVVRKTVGYVHAVEDVSFTCLLYTSFSNCSARRVQRWIRLAI